MNFAKIKTTAKEDIFVRLTFDGAFQRSKIYKRNVPDTNRKEFRKFMAVILFQTLGRIQKRKKYTDKDHYDTILRFSKKVTNKYSKILNRNKLRIGNAQKFLNLYWKVCWLLQPGIREPIHCPFDAIVIKHLGKDVQNIAWTKFHSMKDYAKLVEAAKAIAGANKSISKWELEIYQKAINYS
jgi:hypothetical protein